MKIFNIDISRFWAKIAEILVLVAPFILALLGIDIIPGVDMMSQIAALLSALVVAVKDLIQIITGYFNVRESLQLQAVQGKSTPFKLYRSMNYAEYESARLAA